jgi:hypothetical protein
VVTKCGTGPVVCIFIVQSTGCKFYTETEVEFLFEVLVIIIIIIIIIIFSYVLAISACFLGSISLHKPRFLRQI